MNEYSNSVLYCNWIVITGSYTVHYALFLVFSDMIQRQGRRMHTFLLMYCTVVIVLPNKHENYRTFVVLIMIE